jgi:hypothetical protein
MALFFFEQVLRFGAVRFMTGITTRDPFPGYMYLHANFVVTIKAQAVAFSNKEIALFASMRIVADRALADSDRPVDPLFAIHAIMAVIAKFIFGASELEVPVIDIAMARVATEVVVLEMVQINASANIVNHRLVSWRLSKRRPRQNKSQRGYHKADEESSGHRLLVH